MSKLFNAFYFSAENGYGDEETFLQHQRDNDNYDYELFEAEQDLLNGIQDNRPFEFVFLSSTNYTTPLNIF